VVERDEVLTHYLETLVQIGGLAVRGPGSAHLSLYEKSRTILLKYLWK
jgi:hypothetical protein